ncbi:hypothetical protein PUN28_011549 [Cardiocondyla obscurior]|uniref:Secreted protein n=1 Tax=Cardiocondyla obscurior TaxID=286306 RepID=A0AAW2FJZ0_9HYME
MVINILKYFLAVFCDAFHCKGEKFFSCCSNRLMCYNKKKKKQLHRLHSLIINVIQKLRNQRFPLQQLLEQYIIKEERAISIGSSNKL